MKITRVREIALGLPETTEAPHHHFSSFRVRGKIFVTVPPDEEHIHVFVGEDEREAAVAMSPKAIEPLRWGGRIMGVRVALAHAKPALVKTLIERAWALKAPARLRPSGAAARSGAASSRRF